MTRPISEDPKICFTCNENCEDDWFLESTCVNGKIIRRYFCSPECYQDWMEKKELIRLEFEEEIENAKNQTI